MSKRKLIARLKAEHGIDVEDLQKVAAQRSDMSQLTAALTEALKPAGELYGREWCERALGKKGKRKGEFITLSDVVGAVAELAEKNAALSKDVGKLLRKDAEAEIEGYVSAGRLLPKTRKHAVRLVLAGDREGLDGILAPASQPYVRLNDVQ